MGISVKVSAIGSHSVVVNVLAAKRSGSLPDPWISSTRPFASMAAWAARTGDGAPEGVFRGGSWQAGEQ